MRYFRLLLLMFLCQSESIAQQQHSPVFNSYNSIGFVAGKSPVAFTAQTVNGLSFNKWFVGAGFGIDDYFIKTLPLFIDVKRAFDFKKSHLFLYADVGSHFVTKDKRTTTSFSTLTNTGNLYLDAGLGITIKTAFKNAVFFSVGNTLKNITKTETSLDTGYPYKSKTDYKLSRIVFKAGYRF